LFPWVVSDFSLIDAIESGIVKIPRVPIADNTPNGLPTGGELWLRIREQLSSFAPRKNVLSRSERRQSQIPKELEGALHSLYAHYDREYQQWASDPDALALGRTPPVFIVICNNTRVSKRVFDWITGYETGQAHPDGAPVAAPGHLSAFSNVENHRWRPRPHTILVDSRQLASGEDSTDEDLLREVLNTVGKPGRPGEAVRCVVSVSMLTEGWDVNSVTHILGIRAFGTQLLCEQVIGRGLRRRSYTVNERGHLDPEYAEVYGVPFAFIPCAGTRPEARDTEPPTRPARVRAIPERAVRFPWVEITYPRLAGYRHEVPPDRLEARFSTESRLILSTQGLPARTANAPLDDLRGKRMQEVAFALARLVLTRYFPANDPAGDPGGAQVWLFPQVLAITRQWLAECLCCEDRVFPQMLLLDELAHAAAEKIHRSIAAGSPGESRIRAIPEPNNALGTTALVSFDSRRERWRTREDKCHINYAIVDSDWERGFVQTLEQTPEVKAYVKNVNLGFKIPYMHEGRPGHYYPHYLVRVDDGHGEADLLNLIVEHPGRHLERKEAKVDAAQKLWVPAVNAERIWGRWAFQEIRSEGEKVTR
jgi:type III restriction enzyme